LRGAYTERYGDRTRSCAPSTLVFHPPAEEHEDLFHQDGGRLFRIEIEPVRLGWIQQHTSLSQHPADFRGGRLAFLATRLYREFCQEDPAAALAMEGLFLEMLAEAARSSTPAPPAHAPRWLGRVKELLHQRFSESLTLRTIAESVSVHPVHLVRTFRRFQQSTIGDYLRRLRVEFAGRQLAATDAPLAAVALASGFADQSHFTKTFKRLTGLTPAQYRAAARGAQDGQRR
jgi:AraC family transcriptional regulator